jgi:hypothetical protein
MGAGSRERSVESFRIKENEMKLVNDTTDNIAVPLKGGEYQNLRPGETKSVSNINTENARFKGLMASSALRDADAKPAERGPSAVAPATERAVPRETEKK